MPRHVSRVELRKRNLQFEVAQEQAVGSVLGGPASSWWKKRGNRPIRMKDTLRIVRPRAAAPSFWATKATGPTALRAALTPPSVVLEAPETVRVVVRDAHIETLVFLYNLNIERSLFEDRVTPAENLRVTVTVPSQPSAPSPPVPPTPGALNGTLPHTAEPTQKAVNACPSPSPTRHRRPSS
jgi:hypothetical protein